jgi:hypothetical protein
MWLNPRRNCRGVGLVKRLTILRFGNLSLALWADAKRARNFRRIDQSTGVRRSRASLTQFARTPNGSMMPLVIADHAFRVGQYSNLPFDPDPRVSFFGLDADKGGEAAFEF